MGYDKGYMINVKMKPNENDTKVKAFWIQPDAGRIMSGMLGLVLQPDR